MHQIHSHATHGVLFPAQRWRSSVIVLLLACLLSQHDSAVTAQSPLSVDVEFPIDTGPRKTLQVYKATIAPLLKKACFDCHRGNDAEGNFRADRLDPDLLHGEDMAWWMEVYSVLSKGEMPPADSSELDDNDRTRIVDWLSSEIQIAESLRKATGHHSSFRRLTRYEYNYAMQDLLGVPWTFASDLPDEASEDDAFENNADSLHMSAKQVEAYHGLALKALRRVTVRGDRPPAVHWAVSMKEAFQREKRRLDRNIKSTKEKYEDMPDKLAEKLERLNREFQTPPDRSHHLELSTGLRAEMDWDYRRATYAIDHQDTSSAMPELGSHFAVIQPGARESLTVELGDRLPNEGTMRVRVRASRADGALSRIPSLQLHFGFQATDQGRSTKRLSQQDMTIEATYGQPEIYQWEVPLSEIEHRNTYRGEMQVGQHPSPSEYIRLTNSTIEQDESETEGSAVQGDEVQAAGSAILIDYVEVTAPVYEQWPPKSHQDLLVPSESSRDEREHAREIIANFMTRAWRESPTPRDLDRKLRVFNRLRSNSGDFQEAIIETLAAVLTSPKFLYVLPGSPVHAGSHVLAGKRESPDTQSNERISQNELATRLSLFLWCSLPDATLLDLASEGRLDDPEILQEQVSRMLADSRAARFAKHFVGQWLKMRPLEFVSPSRGKDGIDSALLESMKHEPVALFTDMLQRDASVLDFIDCEYVVVNERLAQHYEIQGVEGNHFRSVPVPEDLDRGGLLTQAGLLTMNSDGKDSHPVKRGVWLLTNLLNDPPPAPPPAVPEIDLSDPEIAKMTLKERIEDHRNHAACLSCHKKIDPWGIAFENFDAFGRWRREIDGKQVDAVSALPDNEVLDGMNGLKNHLIHDRQQQFVEATLEKLSAFALGRQLTFGDRAQVKEITEVVRQSGDGLTTMIMCLVRSELFRTK